MPKTVAPRRPSVMSHQFAQVPSANIQRSSFNRSHGYKSTFDSGFLVPVFVDEVLPGDTFNLKMTAFGRLATPIHPFMDNLFMDSFFFFVPNRLIWDNWQKFNGEQVNPGDSVDFIVPTMNAPAGTGYAELTLQDYMGIPTKVADLKHNSLHTRAYNLIFNEWFRDENLISSVKVDKGDGPDDPADYVLLRRNKRHDYFTSSLPWPQKGPAVALPLTGNAPVKGIGILQAASFDGTARTVRESGSTSTTVYAANKLDNTGNIAFKGVTSGLANPDISADLSSVTAATINELRQAFQIQKMYERDARGGTRYTEIVRSHFGVISPDARLQRPEYLGGGSTPVNVNPVAQTSATQVASEPSPQGNLAAFGTVQANNHGFTKSFTEHGVVIGLVNVRADLNYQQGLNRMWSRSSRFDFYWPALSHLGEQSVLNKEIFADATAADEQVFGYQERYAEYRYKPSVITGRMRSNAATPLDTWHLAQNFATRPGLNASFIEENPPVSRVLAVASEPQFLFDAYFNLQCVRPMPVYSVPGLIDHF